MANSLPQTLAKRGHHETLSEQEQTSFLGHLIWERNSHKLIETSTFPEMIKKAAKHLAALGKMKEHQKSKYCWSSIIALYINVLLQKKVSNYYPMS